MAKFKKGSRVFAPCNFLNERALGIASATKSKLLNHRLKLVNNLYRRDLKAHFGCVNAIEFSHGDGEWIVSGGDDRRAMLWNVEKTQDNYGSPVSMKGEHHSNIFCLAFNATNKIVYSGGNDEQVISHDVATGETKDVFLHEDAVYGLSVDPENDNVFASACDDGRILIYDTRAPADEDAFCLANYTAPMHAVAFNPAEPRLVATANSREGLGLWDVRKPRSCLIRYGGSLSQQSCMSVRINQSGDRLIGLRRRLPPVLYDLHSSQTLHQFDHSGYYNSCTMKSCCFAGDKDQYILSGSDDFNLYMWRIPEDSNSENHWVGSAHLVLHGHRSIVNQVRFNAANHLIISSGVEKIIKMWSPFRLPGCVGDLGLSPVRDERSVYTHEQYINLVLRTGQFMTHDYSNESTDEDPRMMAFFDSLVQRELEGWSSEDSFSSTSPIHDDHIFSDRSHTSSPVDQILVTDTMLRLFSPGNIERSTLSASVAEPNSGDVTVEQEGANPSESRTILDMDNQERGEAETAEVHCETDNNIDIPERVPFGENETTDGNQLENNENVVSVNSADLNTNPLNTSALIASDQSASSSADAITAHSPTESMNTTAGEGNSRDMSIQRNNESEASMSGIPSASTSMEIHLPASRVASYKSISELIQQKRKDYLIGIKKLEKRALRRKLRMLARRKEKLKRIRERLLPRDYNTARGDSDSDKQDEETDDIKEAQFSSDDSSSSSSSSSSSDIAESRATSEPVMLEVIEKRREIMNRVRRYKQLRKRTIKDDMIVSSDSNDSDGGKGGSRKTSELGITTFDDESVNGSDRQQDVSEVASGSGVSTATKSGPITPVPVYEDISNDSCPSSSPMKLTFKSSSFNMENEEEENDNVQQRNSVQNNESNVRIGLHVANTRHGSLFEAVACNGVTAGEESSSSQLKNSDNHHSHSAINGDDHQCQGCKCDIAENGAYVGNNCHANHVETVHCCHANHVETVHCEARISSVSSNSKMYSCNGTGNNGNHNMRNNENSTDYLAMANNGSHDGNSTNCVSISSSNCNGHSSTSSNRRLGNTDNGVNSTATFGFKKSKVKQRSYRRKEQSDSE